MFVSLTLVSLKLFVQAMETSYLGINLKASWCQMSYCQSKLEIFLHVHPLEKSYETWYGHVGSWVLFLYRTLEILLNE